MENTFLSTLDFPLILLGPKNDRTVEIVRSLEQLTTTTKLGLKQESLLGCVLLDAKGKLFEIESIAKKKNRNPFWKFEFFNPMIEIEIGLKEAGQKVNFSEIKEHIKFAINQNVHVWRENFNIKSLKEKIDISESPEAIMEALTTIN